MWKKIQYEYRLFYILLSVFLLLTLLPNHYTQFVLPRKKLFGILGLIQFSLLLWLLVHLLLLIITGIVEKEFKIIFQNLIVIFLSVSIVFLLKNYILLQF